MTFFYYFTGSHKETPPPLLSKNAIRDVLKADSQDISSEHTLSKSSPK